jgi:hypothetical protein
MIKTLQLFKNEKVVIDRERSTCQYRAAEYLLAKAAAELPGDAIIAAVKNAILPISILIIVEFTRCSGLFFTKRVPCVDQGGHLYPYYPF